MILPQRIFTIMAFKEVYDCEILISEIEKRPALCDCSIKEYSDKSFKDRLWGEVCEAVVSEWSQLDALVHGLAPAATIAATIVAAIKIARARPAFRC
jgi:hypothetical protein